MESLKITIIQAEIVWENVAENISTFSKKINAITEPTDIIVLPEMFTTGFTMKSEELAETMTGKTVTWMKTQAKKSNAVIIGSLIIKEHEKYFNRLVWMQPDGDFYTYDKRHLFRMANEHQNYSAGNKRLIVEYKGWKICPLVCYDLRFPELYQQMRLRGADFFSIPSAFTATTGLAHWEVLLRARAIENLCYVLAANQGGTHKNGRQTYGHSMIVDPWGKIMGQAGQGEAFIVADIDLSRLQELRTQFPCHEHHVL